MKYFYSNAILPGNRSLIKEIGASAERLNGKLRNIDLSSLGISEYNQRYIGAYLRNFRDVLQMYSHLLSLALTETTSLKNQVFVDYGGGSGILSLLAKELGIGTVIYNDIYDVSCHDANLIARAIHNESDAYVCGDIDDLILYVKRHNISVDVISSYDVIEHIYDIERYFRKLRFLSKNSLTVVFGSSANIHNPRIKKIRMKEHLRIEYTDRERKWGHKERDALRSYFNIRKEIISNLRPELHVEIVEQLAKKTRGLIKSDIENYLEEYIRTGSISYKPDHPTNTCDPFTGNWNEHLLETSFIKNILISEGYDVRILGGYYSSSRYLPKQLVKYFLNGLISILRSKSLVIAPYYIVYANYRLLG